MLSRKVCCFRTNHLYWIWSLVHNKCLLTYVSTSLRSVLSYLWEFLQLHCYKNYKLTFYMMYSLDDGLIRPTSNTSPAVSSIFTSKSSNPVDAIRFINTFCHFTNSNVLWPDTIPDANPVWWWGPVSLWRQWDGYNTPPDIKLVFQKNSYCAVTFQKSKLGNSARILKKKSAFVLLYLILWISLKYFVKDCWGYIKRLGPTKILHNSGTLNNLPLYETFDKHTLENKRIYMTDMMGREHYERIFSKWVGTGPKLKSKQI